MFKKAIFVLGMLCLIVLSCSKIAKDIYWDISQNKINTLNAASLDLLHSLEHPLLIEVYSPKTTILNYCNDFLEKYRHASSLVTIKLKQTLIAPELATKLKLQTEHNITVSYQGQQQGLDVRPVDLTEQNISNLIFRSTVKPNQWLTFLSGHDEPDPYSSDLFGLSSFTKLIKDRGLHVASLNIAAQQQIPANTDTIIVVNPQVELLTLEKQLLHEFLKKGGKILWFTEPYSPATSFLSEEFGVQLTPGVVIDPHSTKLGSPHPAVKIITTHADHRINKEFNSPILLPWSGNLQRIADNHNWQHTSFITTNADTWTYVGPATENINGFALHKGFLGPLTLGMAFTKNTLENNDQHALVVADSSFILNKYLSLYGNAQFSANMLSWLQTTSASMAFSAVKARDLSYFPNHIHLLAVRYGFAILLPLLLVGAGYWVSLRKP